MAMTEIDFTRDICPDTRRFQLDADNAKATQINLPHWVRKVTIRIEFGPGARISFLEGSGDDINADFIKLDGHAMNEFTVWDGYNHANSIDKFYIANNASFSTAQWVSVMIEGAQ